MNILVGRVFGLGNAVCGIPLLKALRMKFPNARIDVLVGDTSDDFGAHEVLSCVGGCLVGKPRDIIYDIAIMAIPFDGRWKNGRDYKAKIVMDERGRPGHSKVFGFSSWKHHEIEYSMENAYSLGYKGEIPNCSFHTPPISRSDRSIYLGMGFKRDQSGFFSQKHWGNKNYIQLVKRIFEHDEDLWVWSSGNARDYEECILPVSKGVNYARFVTVQNTLEDSFKVMNQCSVYVGNDTGMMHVAASMGLGVVSVFKLEGSITKSRPWCDRSITFDGSKREITPDEMFEAVKEMLSDKAIKEIRT